MTAQIEITLIALCLAKSAKTMVRILDAEIAAGRGVQGGNLQERGSKTMNEKETREEIIAHLREIQRLLRALAEHDAYNRGVFNGIELTLAELEDADFSPILLPSLEPDDDITVQGLQAFRRRQK